MRPRRCPRGRGRAGPGRARCSAIGAARRSVPRIVQMPSGSPLSVSVDRRVVQQHDRGSRSAATACSPRRGRRPRGGLGVDRAQQRLAEVRQVRAGEAADEALEPDDPDLDAVDADRHALAFEHGDPRVLEDRRDLADAGRSASRGCPARRRSGRRGRGRRRPGPAPARAGRGWSGRRRAAAGRCRRRSAANAARASAARDGCSACRRRRRCARTRDGESAIALTLHLPVPARWVARSRG